MKSSIIDAIAEDLGAVYDLLEMSIKLQQNNYETIAQKYLGDDHMVLLLYSKGYLENAFLNLEKLT